jgi:thiamine-phosphate pyrophosphorylase
MIKDVIDYSLYLVTDRELLGGKDLVTTVEQAILGGVTMVQIREKNLSTLNFFQCALLLKAITEKYNVPFIVNDRLDIALAVEADGLHIGQDDMPLSAARKLLGPDKIIGVSVSTVEQALLAQAGSADYVGVGAVFPTATKTNANSVSLQSLEDIKRKITIPVVAIGGINENNISNVMATGIAGAAVVSAIVATPDPYASATKLRQLMKGVRG